MMAGGRDDPTDDLYSGYGREDVAPDLDTEGLQYDEGFQVRTLNLHQKIKSTWQSREKLGIRSFQK